MITTLIIIAGYAVNIFLTRWLNKIMYKKDAWEIEPILWFVPIIPAAVLFIRAAVLFCGFLINCFPKLEQGSNWFTGKNWIKEPEK